ncbi:MAG: hypothetical protein Q7T74_02035 [Candidatus Saccharibacteria bacterium]|nr:hypothetical protein [Candidatus Saccharibacteria bacterium]
MTEQDLTQLTQKLTTEAKAGAGYGMALTMSTEAAKNVGETTIAERQAKRREKIANAKLEQLKGNELVNKLSATCLDGVALAKDGWASVLGKMSIDRIACAKRREESLLKMDTKVGDEPVLETSFYAQKAVGKEQPNKDATRKDRSWWPARALEWVGNLVKVESVVEWAHTARLLAHEAKATKFERQAKEWSGSATELRARATAKRGGNETLTAEMKAKIESNKPTTEDLTNTAEMAKQARASLDTIKNEQYFAPEATELHDAIVSTGGVDADAKINAAAQEWAGRATGVTSTN